MCPVSPRIQWLVGFWWLAGIVSLTGCASVIPEALEKQVDREVQFSDLQRDTAHYQGRLVVLGGQIYALRSSEQVTELEITEFPLRDGSDSPRLSATSSGRFLVAHEGPLDPELYRPGRPITVVGLVQGGRISPGQDLPRPVLEPKYMYLWSDRPPVYDGSIGSPSSSSLAAASTGISATKGPRSSGVVAPEASSDNLLPTADEREYGGHGKSYGVT